jgi:hypothetical protein
MSEATFAEWFAEQREWWKPESAQESLLDAWTLLEENGCSGALIADVFNAVIGTIREEYGE